MNIKEEDLKVQTVWDLERWMEKHKYESAGNGGYVYNNQGYMAVYGKPDLEYILQEIKDAVAEEIEEPSSWITDIDDLISDVVHDRIHSYYIYSRG